VVARVCLVEFDSDLISSPPSIGRRAEHVVGSDEECYRAVDGVEGNQWHHFLLEQAQEVVVATRVLLITIFKDVLGKVLESLKRAWRFFTLTVKSTTHSKVDSAE